MSETAPTIFPELNELLAELVVSVDAILANNLVGAYLTGSFALGAGDLYGDCDFLIVVDRQVKAEQERALRELHAEIPTRSEHWAHHLEGSYAPRSDLETLAALGNNWLYIDHGWREMQWSSHCNQADVRWTLREHGLVLAGRDTREFAAKVPADVLRSGIPPQIQSFLPDLFGWTNFDIAWTQRYAVTTLCRMLYTLDTGEVASKRTSLDWAKDSLAPAWRDLILQVIDDRPLASTGPPRPGSVDATIAFCEYAKQRAVKSLR